MLPGDDLPFGGSRLRRQYRFKALQTYSDGHVVCWIDEPSNNSSGSEHAASVLKLAKKFPTTPTAAVAAADTATTSANEYGLGDAAEGLAVT